MQIVGCQFDIVWEDKAANTARVERLLTDARIEPGALVVLPEMFATGFSMDVAAVAEDEAAGTQRFMAELARRLDVFLLGGLVVRSADGRGANEAVAVGRDGAEVARYRKLHPFSFAGETDHYCSGDRVVTFECGPVGVAPLICYDLRFPEAFRVAARRGVELFCVIANWPAARESHWVALLRARAIENQAYVIGVNRCGQDPNVSYSGRSLIVDPWGEVLADAGQAPGLIMANLDQAGLARYRREFPALADARDDLAPGGLDGV